MEQKDSHHQNLMAKYSNRRGNLGKGVQNKERVEPPGMDSETS